MAEPGSLSPAEQRALEAVDLAGLLGLLEKLVAIPSLDGHESPAQELVAEELAAAGMDVDAWDIDLEALRRHPVFSEEIVRDDALGVVGTTGGDAGSTLALNGHVDVVPVGDERAWSVPPWQMTRRAGRVYGRGVVDMKGGLACAIYAVRAIRDAGVALQGCLSIQSVVGEEDGGTGTLATIERGHRADAAVVVEPTGLRILATQAGAVSFRIRLTGRSAHACVRQEGVSTLDKLPLVLEGLRCLEAERNQRPSHPLLARHPLPIPLSVGRVRAGDWPSSVPDWLELEGRYGIAPGESVEAACAELESAVRNAAAQDDWLRLHPPTVEWWGGRFESASTDVDSTVVRVLRQTSADLFGEPAALDGATYGSDMRLLVNQAQVPTVLFGPGDVRRAHAPDESVSVTELEQAARALTLLGMRFCGVTGH